MVYFSWQKQEGNLQALQDPLWRCLSSALVALALKTEPWKQKYWYQGLLALPYRLICVLHQLRLKLLLPR